METPKPFEQQLAALAPATHPTDAADMMYRCGFAAGQASRVAPPPHTRPAWLPLAIAACLTAVLVGPVSYRLGHLQRPLTVAEQPATETASGSVTSAASDEQAAAAETAGEATASQPRETPHPRPRTVAFDEPANVAQPMSPLFGGWLLGVTPSADSTAIAAPASDIVLTSRPPSADTMAWLERSLPPKRSNPDPIGSLLDDPDTSPPGVGSNPNPHRLPPLPSRNSLHSWEPWIQS